MKTTGAFAGLKILHSGLLAGQILFIALSFYFGYMRNRVTALDNLDRILQVAALVLAGVAFFAGAAFFKKQLAAIRANPAATAKEKLEKYRAASIVQWALLEGACLFCGISYFITGNVAFLALALVLMLVFAMQAPVKSKIAFLLGLPFTDIEEL